MKILVVGGTGFIGPFVVTELVQSGHEVAIFSRGHHIEKLSKLNIHTINGDKEKLFEYREQFMNFGPDVVIHMHAYTEQDAILAMKTFEGVTRRLIVLSSMDVYQAYGILIGLEEGNIISTPLYEDSPLRRKLYPYGGDDEKILVEERVMHSERIQGTILRLPMVFGPGDPSHRLYKYAKRIQDHRQNVVLDELFVTWQSSRGYVENVAHAIVLAAIHDAAANQVYNVSEDRYVTEHEWIEQIARTMNWHGELVSIPREELPEGLIYSSLDLRQNWSMDSQKIRRELNYSELVPSDEAILRTIAWELSNPPEELHPKDYPTFYYELEDMVLSKSNLYK